VELYTAVRCPYCWRAKQLLDARGIPYEEIDVGDDDHRRDDVIRRSGRRTVPQIFIDGRAIGGFEELVALDASGGLLALVGAEHGGT
jgi:glutaredoxin 3